MAQHCSGLFFILVWAAHLIQNCHGATLRGDGMEKRWLEDQSQANACTLIDAKADFCSSGFQEIRPWCTPFVSPDFCPRNVSFSALISERTRAVQQNHQLLGDWWFHHLEDKMAAYAFSVTNGFAAPKLYYCGSLQDADFSALPPNFVIRSNGLHSTKGIYAFPNGLGGVEVLRGIEMDLEDVKVDLMVQGTPEDLVLIEEFVPGDNTALPIEIKFHVIDGTILSVNVVYNRGTPCACWLEMDDNRNRLDQHGCFTPSGGAVQDDGGCYDIDFETGSKALKPMKGFDLCSSVPSIDACVWKHMLQEARRASKIIGVYMRIDMFLGHNGQFFIQEYSTNHMNGLRHCSAKISDSGCIDACFQGRLWQSAGGNSTMGGALKPLPSEMASFLQKETMESKCMAVMTYSPLANDPFDCQGNDVDNPGKESTAAPTANPSALPSLLPSVQPSHIPPSGNPLANPSTNRSMIPSVSSSVDPSDMPSASPLTKLSNPPSAIVSRNTELPSTVPTVSPDDVPLSDTVRDFISRSFANSSTSAAVSQKIIEMEGSLYEANYNVSINEDGVVSLAAVNDLIENITCRLDESIVIGFDRDAAIDAISLEKMFPVGAILVVDSDVFGPCRLSMDTALPDLAPNETSLSFEDGFLFIKTVVESPSIVEGQLSFVIHGEDTSYFTMFSEGAIVLERLEPVASERGIRDLATIRRSFTQEFDLLALFEVTAQLRMTHVVDFNVMRAYWNASGFDLTVEAKTESIYEAELSMLLKIGIFDIGKTFDFVSIPLYGIPTFPLLKQFDIPSPKLGFYFETPIVLNVDASLQKRFGASGQVELRTGRKLVQYFIRGTFAQGLSAGSSIIIDEPASQSASVAPIGEFLGEPFVLKIDFFVGVQPRVALYVTKILSAGISLDIGVEFATQYPVSSDAFKPLPPPGSGVPQFFECETCHKVRVDVEYQITNLKLFAKAVLKYKFIRLFKKFDATFPGNPTVAIPLATACFSKQFGENTETCGDVCCDKDNGQVCELDDSLSPPSGNCDGPSTAPTSSPTVPRVRVSGIFGDPHLSTFDGLRYDCQAAGVFTMVKSLDSIFEIQERFVAVGELPCLQASVSTAVAIREENFPTFQFSVKENGTDFCTTDLHVGGLLMPQQNVSGLPDGVVINSDGIDFLETGVRLKLQQSRSSTFGCLLNVQVFLPSNYRATERIVGLLGSPNDDPTDDWMARNGTTLSPPRFEPGLAFGESFEYCTQNWCSRNKLESLFTYTDGEGLDDFFGCDQLYDDTIEDAVANASEYLRNLCQGDAFCIFEGVCGGISDAQAVIINEAELQMARIEFDSIRNTSASTVTLPPSMESNLSSSPSDMLTDLPAEPSLLDQCSLATTEVFQSGSISFSSNATSIPLVVLSIHELDDIPIDGDFPGCSKVLFEFEVDYTVQPAQELSYRLSSFNSRESIYTEHIVPNQVGGSFIGSSGLQSATTTVDQIETLDLFSWVDLLSDDTNTSGIFSGTLTYTLTIDALESDCSCPLCDFCGDGSDPLESEVCQFFNSTGADDIFCSVLQSTVAYHCCSNKDTVPDPPCNFCGDGALRPRSDARCIRAEYTANFFTQLFASLLDGLTVDISPICDASRQVDPESREACCS